MDYHVVEAKHISGYVLKIKFRDGTEGDVGGQMAWGLLLMGCLFGLALVMIKAPSPMLIAVGMYLPLETTSAIFVGGAMKWVADARARRQNLSAEEMARFEERGTLLASGFIAGEAITGILLAALFLAGVSSLTHVVTGHDELPFLANWGGPLSLPRQPVCLHLYCFFVINHSRRRVLHFNATEHPTSHWIAQQLREAFPEDTAPRCLILDRDRKYEGEATEALQSMSSELIRTAHRSPWQNGVAERWVESCRRAVAGPRDRVQSSALAQVGS